MPIFLLIWILNQNFVLTPHLAFIYKPDKTSSRITPEKKVRTVYTADKQLPWLITSDSYPFTVTIPRLVHSISVKVKLNAGNQPTVYFTWPAKSDLVNSKILVNSSILNTLDWPHFDLNGLTLWQRDKPVSDQGKNYQPPKRYSSAQDFLANPPDLRRVAAIGIDPLALSSVIMTVPNYQSANQPLTFGHTLRGSHDFYVYAADEDIRLNFKKFDLNRKKGKSSMRVAIGRVDQQVEGEDNWKKIINLGDDGVTDGSGRRGQPQTLDLRLSPVTPGLYLIRIATSEDVLFTKIVSQQHAIVTKRLWLAEGRAYGPEFPVSRVQLKTNGSYVAFQPNHDPGKQTVTVNEKKYKIKEVKKDYYVSGLPGQSEISFPSGDIVVSTDGFITLANAELIPHVAMAPLDISQSHNLDNFDYLLANYLPKKVDRIIEIKKTFYLKDLRLTGSRGKSLNFSIYSPGLQANDRLLGLDQIKVILDRGVFPWDKVWKNIGQIFNIL